MTFGLSEVLLAALVGFVIGLVIGTVVERNREADQ